MRNIAHQITFAQINAFQKLVVDAGRHALGQVSPTRESLAWLLDHEGDAFRDAVRRIVRELSVPKVFPLFLEIEIEVGGRTREEFLELFAAQGVILLSTPDLMMRPGWRPGKRERVRFIRTAIGTLGFSKWPNSHTEVWTRIQELGYALCEPGDGPALRLAFPEQPCPERLLVAMETISDADGQPRIFQIVRQRTGELQLNSSGVRPGIDLSPDVDIVFRLCK